MHGIPTFKALGDESRLRIVHLLSKGFLNVQELTSVLGISQPTVSHHLKALQTAGLIKPKRDGTWIFYRLTRPDEDPFSFQILSAYLSSLDGSPTQQDLTADLTALENIVHARRERSRQFFEENAPRWGTTFRPTGDTEISYFDKLTKKIPAKATLLDIGCGSGALLKELLPRSGQTIGVDYSPSMLNEARKNLGVVAQDVDFRIGSIEHLPVADTSIDIAVLCMVLHHIPNPVEAIEEAKRVIKPGGSLLVVDFTPHQDERMREQLSDLWLGFEPTEVTRWFSSHGFSHKEPVYFGKHREVFLLEGVHDTASSLQEKK